MGNFRMIDFFGPEPGKTYLVPNTAVVWISVPFKWGDRIPPTIVWIGSHVLEQFAKDEYDKGFKVVDKWKSTGDSALEFADAWNTDGIYEFAFTGHGNKEINDEHQNQFISEPSTGAISHEDSVTPPPYRLAQVVALHCWGWEAGWRRFVSRNGGRFTAFYGNAYLIAPNRPLRTETLDTP